MRTLAARDRVKALNVPAEVPGEPPFAACSGGTDFLTRINRSEWSHGMDLHGHHFRPVDPNGVADSGSETVRMEPDEALRIGLVADNPGDWLLHCHMLEPSVAGMPTWFRVARPRRSGDPGTAVSPSRWSPGSVRTRFLACPKGT